MSAPPSHRLATFLGAITTQRLRLAPLTMRDAEDLWAITSDPAITGAISFLSTPFTKADAGDLIRQGRSDRDSFFGIRDRNDGRLKGVIGAHLRGDDDIEIGYWIGRAFLGLGIATEATGALIAHLEQRLPQRRVIAECRPENQASWRVLTKVGFVATGTPGLRSGRQRLVLSR